MPIRTVIIPNLGFRSAQIKDSQKRKANIKLLKDVGREKWQEATSYGKRSGVENTNSRYKTIFGGKLRSKDTDNQNTEVQIGIRILNRMRTLGIPEGNVLRKILTKVGGARLHFLLCNNEMRLSHPYASLSAISTKHLIVPLYMLVKKSCTSSISSE